jgi:hypothetical protein
VWSRTEHSSLPQEDLARIRSGKERGQLKKDVAPICPMTLDLQLKKDVAPICRITLDLREPLLTIATGRTKKKTTLTTDDDAVLAFQVKIYNLVDLVARAHFSQDS